MDEQLFELADKLRELREEKDSQNAILKDINADIDTAEYALTEAMAKAECPSFTRKDKQFIMTTTTRWLAAKDRKEALYSALKANDYDHLDSEIEETEREIKRISGLRQSVYDYEDYAAKLLTVSAYQFAVEKYNADSEKLKARLEIAKQGKADYSQKSTPSNKWLAAFLRFMDEKELTAEMAKALIERVEVSDKNRVTIFFKFRDEYAEISRFAEAA
ncbi:hypothetical protein FACS1894208_06430 [Clostridia bacterium]|nr:hypothetical protein FACS1894208_06430 [Clostridia bacterium]